jgi:hypothetical protein
MSIQVYKKGDTHTIRGVSCEMATFPVSYLHQALKQGYVTSPSDIESKQAAPVVSEEVAVATPSPQKPAAKPKAKREESQTI